MVDNVETLWDGCGPRTRWDFSKQPPWLRLARCVREGWRAFGLLHVSTWFQLEWDVCTTLAPSDNDVSEGRCGRGHMRLAGLARLALRILLIALLFVLSAVYVLVILGFSIQFDWERVVIIAASGIVQVHTMPPFLQCSTPRLRVYRPMPPQQPNSHVVFGDGLPRMVPSWGAYGKPRYGLETPLWLLVAVSTIVGIVIWRHTRPVAGSATRCEQCSYELWGNMSGICPECGTPITKEQGSLLAAAAPTNASGENDMIRDSVPEPPTKIGDVAGVSSVSQEGRTGDAGRMAIVELEKRGHGDRRERI